MPFRGLGILGYMGVLIIAWLIRDSLFTFIVSHLMYSIGVVGGFFFFAACLPVIEVGRGRALRRFWRQRLERQEGFRRPSSWWHSLLSVSDPINRFLGSFFREGLGRLLLGWWRDARFGSQPLSLVTSLFGTVGGGFLIGYLLTERLMLSGFLAFLLLVGLLTWTYSRARMQRRLFQDQFPGVLDRWADSLQAGFSLLQAVEFIVPNLSSPSSTELRLMSDQIRMGFTVDQALRKLYERRTNQDVRLLVEGLTLQRQVGGNMAVMMRELAEVIRKRVELENEVRTLTAQGRLSAVVISLLVPISLGLLSMFPGYIEVLFNTTVGNLVLIVSGILELVGAVIVARLIRIEV